MKNKIRAFLRMNKLVVMLIGYAIYVKILEFRLWILIKTRDEYTEKDIRFFHHYYEVNVKGMALCDEGIAICHEISTKEGS